MSQHWITRLFGSLFSLFRRAPDDTPSTNVTRSDIDRHFAHLHEPALGADPQPAPMPTETRQALEDIMASPVGDRIRNRHGRGTPLPLVIAEAADVAFSTLEGRLYYTTDVDAFIASRDPEPLPHTLGSLLAHGIGYMAGDISKLNHGEAWSWVVENFENPYREYKGMPLRSTIPPSE